MKFETTNFNPIICSSGIVNKTVFLNSTSDDFLLKLKRCREYELHFYFRLKMAREKCKRYLWKWHNHMAKYTLSQQQHNSPLGNKKPENSLDRFFKFSAVNKRVFCHAKKINARDDAFFMRARDPFPTEKKNKEKHNICVFYFHVRVYI